MTVLQVTYPEGHPIQHSCDSPEKVSQMLFMIAHWRLVDT
jgi:hypothetical protein